MNAPINHSGVILNSFMKGGFASKVHFLSLQGLPIGLKGMVEVLVLKLLTELEMQMQHLNIAWKILYILQGSDISFVEKLNMKFDHDPHYAKSPHAKSGTFTIAHYAGKVSYIP